MKFSQVFWNIVFVLFIVIFLCCSPTHAQTSNITATVTNSDASVVIANANWTASYVKPFNNPGTPTRTDTGVVLTYSDMNKSGTTDSSGAFAVTITRTDFIAPTGGKWKFQICPKTNSGCFDYSTSVITGSLDVGASLSFNAGIQTVTAASDTYKVVPRAYQDSQLNSQDEGSLYWDIKKHKLKGYDNINSVWNSISNPFIVSSDYPNFTAALNALSSGDVILVPANTINILNNYSTNKNFSVVCQDRETSIIRATTATTMFVGSGTVKNIKFYNCKLDGNNIGISFMTAPSFGGSDNWSQGSFIFENNKFINWTSWALDFGTSVYKIIVKDNNNFTNNGGDIRALDFSETNIVRNEFWQPRNGTVNPKIQLAKQSVCDVSHNDFEHLSSTSTAPDLNFNITSGDGGYCNYTYNGFKPEGEVGGARVKVLYSNASNRVIQNILSFGNTYNCGATSNLMSAIKIDGPVSHSSFDDIYNSCYNLVNDNVAYSNGDLSNGNNTFKARVFSATLAVDLPHSIFLNGGKMFNKIEVPVIDTEVSYFDKWQQLEAPELRNRIISSPDMSTVNWTKNNITVTTGQADYWGQTNGMTLTRGTTGSDNIQTPLTMTGAKNKIWCDISFKNVDAGLVTVGLYNSSVGGQVQYYDKIFEDTDWHWYEFAFFGINPAQAYTFNIYPGGTSGTAGQAIKAGYPHCADHPSGFLQTTGVAAVDTNKGVDFRKQVNFAIPVGVSPFSVVSSTKVSNLNADNLDGNDWAIPAPIGSTTPNSGAFTTINSSGQYTNTVAGGTAPLVITSGTKVANLNVDQVDGADWANPAAIGSGTPAAITGTTIVANTSLAVNGGSTITKHLFGSASLDFANLAAIGCEDLTIGVTGAADGDPVKLGTPNGSVVSNGEFFAWVSSANTVSVRFCTLVGGNPASGTFSVVVGN